MTFDSGYSQIKHISNNIILNLIKLSLVLDVIIVVTFMISNNTVNTLESPVFVIVSTKKKLTSEFFVRNSYHSEKYSTSKYLSE